MKNLMLLLTLGLISTAQANPLIGSCSNHEHRVEITRQDNGQYDVQIRDILGAAPSYGYYGDSTRKIYYSSTAKLSRVQSGLLKGCYEFEATTSDPTSGRKKFPLWNLFVCLRAETGHDMAFFDATQFQPTSYRLDCSHGLFNRLGQLAR